MTLSCVVILYCFIFFIRTISLLPFYSNASRKFQVNMKMIRMHIHLLVLTKKTNSFLSTFFHTQRLFLNLLAYRDLFNICFKIQEKNVQAGPPTPTISVFIKKIANLLNWFEIFYKYFSFCLKVLSYDAFEESTIILCNF